MKFCLKFEAAALREGGARAAVHTGEQAGRPAASHGRAMQVEPIKPTLKAPGIKLLKLKCDRPLSKFALKFNLRCYSTASNAAHLLLELLGQHPAMRRVVAREVESFCFRRGVGLKAGAYTRPLFSST